MAKRTTIFTDTEVEAFNKLKKALFTQANLPYESVLAGRIGHFLGKFTDSKGRWPKIELEFVISTVTVTEKYTDKTDKLYLELTITGHSTEGKVLIFMFSPIKQFWEGTVGFNVYNGILSLQSQNSTNCSPTKEKEEEVFSF